MCLSCKGLLLLLHVVRGTVLQLARCNWHQNHQTPESPEFVSLSCYYFIYFAAFSTDALMLLTRKPAARPESEAFVSQSRAESSDQLQLQHLQQNHNCLAMSDIWYLGSVASFSVVEKMGLGHQSDRLSILGSWAPRHPAN